MSCFVELLVIFSKFHSHYYSLNLEISVGSAIAGLQCLVLQIYPDRLLPTGCLIICSNKLPVQKQTDRQTD